MKKKSLSTLGFVMESLNIQTVQMSRSLHVDASLISKWKSGDRSLTAKSIYFDDVIDFIMDFSNQSLHETLRSTLMSLYPHANCETDADLEKLLRQTLASNKMQPMIENTLIELEHAKNISTTSLSGNTGRREAVNYLLTYAEDMSTAGSLIFVDNEDFVWLLEDEIYAVQFMKRVENLVHKDFHITFVLHYSSSHNHFTKLFDLCSPLIFHRNIDWYCHEYYDQTNINFSFFILDHAISILGCSSNQTTSSTLIFQDQTLTIMHELMAQELIKHSHPLFDDYQLKECISVINEISHYRRKGTLYSCLPSPLFLSVRSDLLREILTDNHIGNDLIESCLEINLLLRLQLESYFKPNTIDNKDSFVYIFRLDELIKRATSRGFTSRSLSLACGSPITVSSKHYRTELRNIAKALMDYPTIKVVLVSEKDGINLPNINCWCKQNIWMIQMNKDGLRLSDEFNIVNAATIKWENCLRSVPKERRENATVSQFLLELANEIEYR